MAEKCIWASTPGKNYVYEVYPINANWNSVPGNYIFAKQVSPTEWTALYIGQTESFKDTLPTHSELHCIRLKGGTHIHIHVNRDERARLEEEKDLLSIYRPPCNQNDKP